MNREEIIRMAREAGWTSSAQDIYPPLERFAELVAAAEREACAEICDRVALRYGDGGDGSELTLFQHGFGEGATICRNRIQARGQE